MELDELFGLPAHPLVVHAAVVLLPLAAVATLVCAVVRVGRRRYAPIAFGLAVAALAAVGLAQGSGESLEHRVDRTALVRAHTSQAEIVLPWAIALTVVASLVLALPYLSSRVPRLTTRPVAIALAAVALVAGVGATWSVVEVGHSGARATWESVGNDAP